MHHAPQPVPDRRPPIADALLRSLHAAMSPATGQGFFRSLVDHLVEVCGVDFALVGQLDEHDRIHTLAVSDRGQAVENMVYDLRGTPCEHVVRRELCHFAADFQVRFPDPSYARRNIQSYMGTPVCRADGSALGIVALMHSAPFAEPEVVESVLRLVGSRAGAEMERLAAEQALRTSEARLSAVIDNSPGVAMQWYDGSGRVRRWNRASEQMFGFSSDEAIGRTLDQLIHTEEELVLFRQALHDVQSTGQPIGPVEYVFRRRNGEAGVCLSTIFQIPGESGADWFVCMDVDITARKRAEQERQSLEDQMRHAQKLESLGVLAGGLAHDFNNLLTSMLGYASLAGSELPAGSPVRPLLHEIENAAKRASELTRQMLAYSGRGRFAVQPTSLAGLVEEMSKLLLTVVSKKAAFRLDLQPAVIAADATQIRQIVMNLITNASDALGSQAGVVVLRTGVRRVDEEALRSRFLQHSLPAGEYAFLEVEDTGCGMDEATLGRLFDPFFTTKFTGRGLGLAAVLGIVRGHRGSIQVASEPGRGTTFTVWLPVAGPGVEPAEPAAAAAPGAIVAGTVLVIDDEPDVRRVTCHILQRARFTVLEAGDGPSGVEVFAANRERIEVVLLDLTMPQMDGFEVLQRLRRLSPELPVVLMSGFTDPDMPALEGTARPPFLHKPFLPDELLAGVARARAAGS